MRGRPADEIIAYLDPDDQIVCSECDPIGNGADEEKYKPIFISDEFYDGTSCDSCGAVWVEDEGEWKDRSELEPEAIKAMREAVHDQE